MGHFGSFRVLVQPEKSSFSDEMICIAYARQAKSYRKKKPILRVSVP